MSNQNLPARKKNLLFPPPQRFMNHINFVDNFLLCSKMICWLRNSSFPLQGQISIPMLFLGLLVILPSFWPVIYLDYCILLLSPPHGDLGIQFMELYCIYSCVWSQHDSRMVINWLRFLIFSPDSLYVHFLGLCFIQSLHLWQKSKFHRVFWKTPTFGMQSSPCPLLIIHGRMDKWRI